MNLLPIIAPTIALQPGTLDEANIRGSIMERYLPFKITGLMLQEEGVGDLAQEWWEAGWQQRNMAVGLAGIVVLVGIALALHAPPVWVLLGAVVAIILGLFVVGTYQNAASEEFSHAISVQTSLLYDGLTLERAEQCFIGNLAGYEYSRPLSGDNVRRNYPAAKVWVAANGALMQRFLALKGSMK